MEQKIKMNKQTINAGRRKICPYLLLLLWLWPAALTAQTRSISGTVYDADGSPLAGASVVVKGSTVGTMTDGSGGYAISVPDGATLVFSFLGMTTREEPVDGREHIDVTLGEDAHNLDEVVVVGYGSVKKTNLTGSTDQLRSEVLESRPITSVAQALQGTLANLNISAATGADAAGGGAPGAKMNFNIRGVTGLDNATGVAITASPLFVIDGVQGGDINAVNPDDIESISVLKDAASAAIYGSNAPYGVVIVTTKKGKKDTKPTVTYGANFGWASPINLPTMLGSVEWAELYNEANRNAKGQDYFDASIMQRIRDYANGVITTTTIPSPTSIDRWASYDNGTGNDNINWFKVFYKDFAFNHQHNLGVSGGAERITYYFGLGYARKNGMYAYGKDSYSRYNLRSNLSSDITGWLTANLRTAFTRGVTDTPSGASKDAVYVGGYSHEIARRWPVIPLYNPDGHISEASGVMQMTDGGRNATTDNTATLTGELVVTPLKGWDATFSYTFSGNHIANEDNILHMTAYAPNGNPYQLRNTDVLNRTNERYEQHTINAFTSYERELGRHYLKAMVGFAQENHHIYSLASSSGAGNLFVVDVPAMSAIYDNTPDNSEARATFSSRGVFGRINYGYAERYLLELNGRYDGSSRFLSGVRFKLYPGVSAAWVISRENFWTRSIESWVNLLKIRASYGSLGDQGFLGKNYYPFYPSLNAQAATGVYNKWLFNGNRYSYISYPDMINTSLTWITSTTINAGLDVGAFRNRLTAAFDYYRRSSDDLVGPAEQLPAVLGAKAPQTNNASLLTTGFELTLSWRDRAGKVAYGARATLADSRSVVKKYPNENKAIDSWYNGAKLGDIWGYVTEGYYTQSEISADPSLQLRQREIYSKWTAGDIKYADLDGDGFVTEGSRTLGDHGDLKIIGNNTPRYTFSFMLDAAWKGFDVSCFLQGVGKQDAWMDGETNNYFWGIIGVKNSEFQSSPFTIHRNRWTPENPGGYYPKYYMGEESSKNTKPQTKYLQDASFLRIKNVQLGYTLPGSLLHRARISKIRVYVSGENLATFTSLPKTIDPEFANTSAGKVYPLQRVWSCGLSLTF
ncbi:MAG: TonB-dependent receptor [Prevotellaceae bacterium]|nr:TonB-dependent receptor [Prevotellaceae bacterium]